MQPETAAPVAPAAPAQGAGAAPVPPEEVSSQPTQQVPAQPTQQVSAQPTEVVAAQPTVVAAPAATTQPAAIPVQPTATVLGVPGQAGGVTPPKQPMDKKKRTGIIIGVIAAVVIVGFLVFRSIAASNASAQTHAALTKIAATNEDFSTVNRVCGEYYVGYASGDEISDAQTAIGSISKGLDDAQECLDGAKTFKGFMSTSDQEAYDNLEESIAGRREMIDAATKIAADSKSVVDARDYLTDADTDFYEAEGDLGEAIDYCNELDFDSATSSANDTLAKLTDATDQVNSAKTAFPDADYSEYDTYISKFTDCANTVIKIKDAVNAQDATSYSSLVDQFNSSFDELKTLYSDRGNSYSLFADILDKQESDNVSQYKEGLNTAEKAEEKLANFAGMDMTIGNAVNSFSYPDSSSYSSGSNSGSDSGSGSGSDLSGSGSSTVSA